MTVTNAPVRRRRIAGEAKPDPAAAKNAAKVVPIKKVTPKPPKPPKPPLPARPRWGWTIALVAITIAAVLFGAAFAVRGIAQYRDQGGLDASNAAAAAAAGKAAEAIFSFDYTALDKHRAESDKLMTPKFRKEFDKIAPALTELAPQRKIQIKAMVQDSAATVCASACSTSRASVLVFFDQARLIGDSTTPTVFGNRIRVDMVKQDGTWLVNNIVAL